MPKDTPPFRNPLPSFRDYAMNTQTSGLSAPSYSEWSTTQKTSAMMTPSSGEWTTTLKTSAMMTPSSGEWPTSREASSDMKGVLPSPSDCSLCGRIGLALLAVVLGVCSGMVFALHYHNAHVAFWAFSTGALAALTLFVHVTYARGHYCKKRGRLLFLSFLGTTVSLCTALVLLFYVAMLVHLRQGFQLEGNGYLLAALWGVLSMLWSFQLTYFSRQYCLHPVEEARPLLLLPPSERGLQPAKMQGQCQYDSLE